MTKKILTYIDHFQGRPQASSWEAVGLGRTLAEQTGGQTAAVVLGSGTADTAEQAIHHGADQVFLGDDPRWGDFRPEPLADALHQVVQDYDPDLILFPTTSRTRTLAGMLGADLGVGVLVDVIDLDWEGSLSGIRPIYAGKLLAQVQCTTQPEIITLRGRAFSKAEEDPDREGEIIPLEPNPDSDDPLTTVVDHLPKDTTVSLTDAAVIISGGRGTANDPELTPPEGLSDEEAEVWKAKQGFQQISEVADLLGAAVGASRAAVDAGYISYDHQVGQTGKVVSPDLYIACGISGAIQHLAGMRTSKVIVAINKDPDAPIFNLARFGLVGDMHKILPAFQQELEQNADS